MKFRLRAIREHEVSPGDPRDYMLEVTRGNSTDLFPVTHSDVIALGEIWFRFSAGAALPIESERSPS